MKNKAGITVIAIMCVGLIVGGYYYFVHKDRATVEDAVELTEVQQIITKDLEKNYPSTPRSVVKLYNRIICSFYNETYTEDELYELGDQARMLFDEELLANNPRDTYFESLKADIAKYQEQSKTIKSAAVCDTSEVVYQTVDGDECAYVSASYFVSGEKAYTSTNQMYVLRKDEDGNWKILVFYRVEGDSSDE